MNNANTTHTYMNNNDTERDIRHQRWRQYSTSADYEARLFA
jgi:hypothetical protein